MNLLETEGVREIVVRGGQFEDACGNLKWDSWNYTAGDVRSFKNGTPAVPNRHGVYLIRAPSPLPRVRDYSDVVYIGQSGGEKRKGKQGIHDRLFNTRGPDELVRDKVEALFSQQEFHLECAFVDGQDPEVIEDGLLLAYFEDHCELPPANHKHPKRRKGGKRN